ncbi:MAG: ATP-binding protein, partial [Endomicrobiia bacterium]|nr:ATP-binding protein [Endomicrobiia bacterium]
HPFSQSAMAHLLPVHRPWGGTKQAKMLFPTAGGEIIGLDPFDPALPAKHGLIIGSTGAGKSFTTNYVLTNFLVESQKNHVVIIDVGGSYRKLCDVFNGQYVDINFSDEYAFNPFPSKKFFYKNGQVEPDEMLFMQLILQKMLQRPALSGREQMIIENTIKTVYEKAPGDVVTLGDFVGGLKEYPGDEDDRSTAVSFFKDLGPWVSGRYAVLLNNPRSKLSLDPSKRLVVFDLQKLKDDKVLAPVMFFVIRSAIYSRLADLRLKKIVVIDEGWQFFSDESGSELIENLYRTARKFEGAVFSISQSPEDFLNTPAANSIIGNSYTKYLLRITAKHELLDKFGLTLPEIGEVQSLDMVPGKYSEALYKFNEHSIVLRVVPNKLDYWICTTNAADRNTENDLKKKYPGKSLSEILLMLGEEEL